MFGKKEERIAAFGNWEERGVIGTRVEIDNKKVIVLWRGSPVLETKYKTEKSKDGKLSLLLEKNGLRYAGSEKDYATVTELFLREGRLNLIEFFPITGESKTVLDRTENNRYGNYDIVTKDYLPLLNGSWKDDHGFFTMRFSGSTMELNGRKIEFCVLKPRGSSLPIRIVNVDPGSDIIGDFCSIEFKGGEIVAQLLVCDAPNMFFIFTKNK